MEPEIDNLGLKTKSCMDRLRRAEGADPKRKYELERVEEVYSREDKEERSKKTTDVAGTALSQR